MVGTTLLSALQGAIEQHLLATSPPPAVTVINKECCYEYRHLLKLII
ncbi:MULTISPECIES: hypothetical protein [unclassified Microcoleus]